MHDRIISQQSVTLNGHTSYTKCTQMPANMHFIPNPIINVAISAPKSYLNDTA